MIIDSISLREHENGGRAVSATIFILESAHYHC